MSVFDTLLNREVALRRKRRTPDGQGGWPEDFVSLASVRGRLRPASSSERESAAQEQRSISHVLYVRAGTDIARGDEATVDGLVVDVQGIREPSKAGEHLEVDCLERQLERTAAEPAGS